MLMKKLDEIAVVRAGGTPSRSNKKYWTNGTIPWIKIGDINGKYVDDCTEFITDTGLDNSSAKLFKKGTLLYTIFATIGEVAILDFDATTNQAIVGIEVIDKSVSTEYLYYYLKHIKKDVIDTARGVAQNNINLGMLRNFNIPLPSPETQKKIVEVLDKAQELIDARKEQIRLMDELIQSVFYEMFGDPVTNPKGFEKKPLGEIFEILTGSTPSRKNNDYWTNSNIPWVKTSEVNFYDIYETDEKVSKVAVKEINLKILPVDTLLIAMYGQGKTRGRVGRLKIEATTNQACAAILPMKKMKMEFVYQYLKQMYNELRALGRGGNQPNLNLGLVKAFEIIIPDETMQNQFETEVERINLIKNNLENSLKELEEFYLSIMTNIFNGDFY